MSLLKRIKGKKKNTKNKLNILSCVEQNISSLQQSTFLSIRRKTKRSMRVQYIGINYANVFRFNHLLLMLNASINFLIYCSFR